MNETLLHLLGYLNNKQWIDALKHDAENVKPYLYKVEDYYSCNVVDRPRQRLKYKLDEKQTKEVNF